MLIQIFGIKKLKLINRHLKIESKFKLLILMIKLCITLIEDMA